jgi:acyl-CoA thioesterase-1
MIKKSSLLFIPLIVALLFLLSPYSQAQTSVASSSPQVIDPASYDHPVRVACLGDSITMGVGTRVPAQESYPAQLQSILGSKWTVVNLGVGGRTLLRKADPYSIGQGLKSKPDVVIIMLGTNDSQQATWDKFGSDFTGDYDAIIDALEKLDTHPKIWICCPPPMFPGHWKLSEDVLTTHVIPAITQVAKDKNVPLIDLHTPLLDQKANFADAVHPNPVAAHRMAEIVAAAITGTATPAP